jgi:hypothetical protein
VKAIHPKGVQMTIRASWRVNRPLVISFSQAGIY